MIFKFRSSIILIMCLYYPSAKDFRLIEASHIKYSFLKAQNLQNSALQKAGFFYIKENENFITIPENNIKKLLRIKRLNTANSKENCQTILCHSDIEFYNNDMSTQTVLSKMYKFNNKNCSDLCNLIITDVRKEFEQEIISTTNLERLNLLERTEIADRNVFPSVKRKTERIRFRNISVPAAIRSSILEFPNAQTGNVTKVTNINLEKDYVLFDFFSELMRYLQPTSFPLSLVKDAMQRRVSVDIVLLKALQLEGPVLAWLFVWFIFALALPCGIMAQFCCIPKTNMQRLHENYSESSEADDGCVNKIYTILMQLFLLLLLSCSLIMITANERISRASYTAPNEVNNILESVESFIKDTQTQISTVTTSSVQITMDALHRDLEGAEELLGKPLQSALDVETGLESVMQALTDLTGATAKLSFRVSALLKDCNEARKVSKSLQRSLIELFRLLTLIRRNCLPRDQALCDTLQTSPLNVSFQIDQLSSDQNLIQLKKLGENNDFNRSVQSARRTFQGLPRRISLDTALSRSGIRSVLNQHRNELYDTIRLFEDSSKAIIEKLNTTKHSTYKAIQNVTSKDLWRWISFLGLSLLIFFVWSLLMCTTPCGCNSTRKTSPFLLTALGLACILSLILWSFGSATFLIGSHFQTLVCEPLYDDPKFTLLNDLLNDKEVFYNNNEFLNDILIENGLLDVEDILRSCKADEPAYNTFKLQGILNLTTLANYSHWTNFNGLLRGFTINISNLEIFSTKLQEQLQDLYTISNLNLNNYISNISVPVINKDLVSLNEQLQNVAKQLSDFIVVEKMNNLADKVKEVIKSEVALLKTLKDNIVYKMIALDVLLELINKQVQQILMHVNAAQDFILYRSQFLVEKLSLDYTIPFENYLKAMMNNINEKLMNDIGKCRPIWDLFDATRTITCKWIINPINGFSFACFLCILLFLGLTPIIIQILEQDKEAADDSFSSITHRRARNGLMIDDEGTWATPSSHSSSEEGPRQAAPSSELAWTVPRQPSEPLIPTPPRIPEHLPISAVVQQSLRILDAARLMQTRIPEAPIKIKSPIPRILQAAGTSRAAKDRYESLKLIERIDRRTPRSWL